LQPQSGFRPGRYPLPMESSLALAMTVAEATVCLKFESDFVARRPGAV
jgi:hypothetical protein